MEDKIQILNRKTREILKPYLDQRQLGNLRMAACGEGEKTLEWTIYYEHINGTTDGIITFYSPDSGLFSYGDDLSETDDIEPIVGYIKNRIDRIQQERLDDLRATAERQKSEEMPMTLAIDDMRRHAGKNPLYGPTEEELEKYEQFCQEVYSQ